MSQGPTDRRDHRARGAGVNDPLATTRQGGGQNRTLRSILAGSKGTTTTRAAEAPTTPTIVPRPTVWTTGALGVPWVRSLPYAGVWQLWGVSYVVLSSGSVSGLQAEATLEFNPLLSLAGSNGVDTWNAFDLLVHSSNEYSLVKRYTTPGIDMVAVDLTNPDMLDLHVDMVVSDSGGPIDPGICQVEIRGTCLTGDPSA